MKRTANAQQIDDVLNALAEPFSIITGPPGVGKTWVVSLLAAVAGRSNIIACAPSATAALRITELTGITAMTIHRLLQWPRHSLENPSIANLDGYQFLIADEASMKNSLLAASLLTAAARANVPHVVFVGDDDKW